MKKPLILLCSIIASLVSHAGVTQSHQANSYETFVKGTFQDVQLSNEGQLSPAPSLSQLASLEDTSIIWEAVSADDGSVYVATGGEDGSVVQITPSGETKTLFTAKGSLIRALALGKNGEIYAGTSQKGALYKIVPGQEPVKLWDSSETYIWSLLVDRSGSIFIGTGQKGKLLQLKAGFKEGDTPEVLFESDADDFTVLAFDAKGALLAGSNTTGLLYRVVMKGKVEVLYNASGAQITGIHAEPKGDIYFTTYAANEKGEEGSNAQGKKGTSLYAVKPDGNVMPIWGQVGVSVYGLSPIREESDEWLLSTGDKGRIYRVTDTWDWALVAQAEGGGQVSSIVADRSNPAAHIVTTSNPARVYRLEAQRSLKGAYLSDPFDAKQVAQWGNIEAILTSQSGDKTFAVETRSGNTKEPDNTWTDWAAAAADGKIGSPQSRFLQYRLRWADSNALVSSVRFFYGFNNVAPEVASIRVLPVGIEVLAVPMPNNQQLNPDILLAADPQELLFASSTVIQEQLAVRRERGQMTIVWKAVDPFHDALVYRLEFQPMGGKEWMTLVDHWNYPLFSFNTIGLEEGYYRARVTASDTFVNLPAVSKSAYRTSMPFLIDNTAPVVTQVGQTFNNELVELNFRASDALSIIVRASYVLDGEDPVDVLPDDGLFDSKSETFTLSFRNLKSGDHSLLVNVIDESNNLATYPASFTVQ